MTGHTPHPGDPVTPSDQPQRGYDIARAALEEARAAARAQGKQTGRGHTGPVRTGGRRRKRGWTGPGADPWDPQPLGRLVTQVSLKRGWAEKVDSGKLFAEWPKIVGEEIAARVDLKADRRAGALLVQSAFRSEATARPDAEIAVELAAELRSMATWLGLSEVHVAMRGDLAAALATAAG